MLEIHEADKENKWIIPVFLDVSPSDIKEDSGSFQVFITENQKKVNLDREQAKKYRCVLRSIGPIAGYSLITDANGDEARLCTMICDRISSILKQVLLGVQPIGIDSQINEVMIRLEGETNGINIVGICGKGGIGKTAIAVTIFDKLSHEFRYTSFISDISAIRRKFGCKKVLIVLDDIDDTKQLDALVDDQVHVKREHVFGAGKKVVKVAGGLPLALKVFGSHFSSINRVREVWEVELGKLQRHSHQKVLERLKICYDGLELTQKYVFLDVACFLIGSSKEEALFFWEDHYAADSAINALESKSLLTMDVDNRFRMHGRIQDMGRWIVKEAGDLNPHMYSRLWDRDDVSKVLEDAKQATERKQGTLSKCVEEAWTSAMKANPGQSLLGIPQEDKARARVRQAHDKNREQACLEFPEGTELQHEHQSSLLGKLLRDLQRSHKESG
ncbi:TMV resistance protein N-like [Nymphaea colorata]|nr:TMV resistance protein N-like [Nymphaea colorata]